MIFSTSEFHSLGIFWDSGDVFIFSENLALIQQDNQQKTSTRRQ